MKGIDLSSLVDNDVDLKIDDFNQNVLLMSPPASDSGSQAGFSPYSIDSEPGSPLLDDAKVFVASAVKLKASTSGVRKGQNLNSPNSQEWNPRMSGKQICRGQRSFVRMRKVHGCVVFFLKLLRLLPELYYLSHTPAARRTVHRLQPL